jgi:UDP-N-acetylmuramate--alanine ligase
LCDVYPAGEEPLSGADGRTLSRAIRARGEVDPVFARDLRDVPHLLGNLLEDGDLVLTMGAGDIGALAARLPELLQTGGDADATID